MNTELFAIFTAIVLVMGLSQPIANAQASQAVLTPLLGDIVLQLSLLRPSQSINSAPSPIPDRGAPRDRKEGASRVSPHSN